MSHSRLHDLFEGVVDPPPHPAADVDALHPKLDRLLCEVLVLQGSEREGEEVQKVCRCFKESASKVCLHSSLLQTHLYIMQNLPEDGALFPPVVLGSMLVAVCGQTLQTMTQALTVLHLELLQKQRAPSLKWTLHNTAVSLLQLHLSVMTLPHRHLARAPPAGRWSLPLRFCS